MSAQTWSLYFFQYFTLPAIWWKILELSTQRSISCPNLNTLKIWNWVLNWVTGCWFDEIIRLILFVGYCHDGSKQLIQREKHQRKSPFNTAKLKSVILTQITSNTLSKNIQILSWKCFDSVFRKPLNLWISKLIFINIFTFLHICILVFSYGTVTIAWKSKTLDSIVSNFTIN